MCHVTDKPRHQRTPTGGESQTLFFPSNQLVPRGHLFSFLWLFFVRKASAVGADRTHSSQAKNRLAVGLFLLYQIHQYNLGYVARRTRRINLVFPMFDIVSSPPSEWAFLSPIVVSCTGGDVLDLRA